jgi:transposase
LLLDDGMTCEATARVLFVDDDTVRTWYQDYQEDGIEGLANFGHEGGTCRLTGEQQDKLKTWIAATLPRTTREVGAWIARECDIEYQTRSGLICCTAWTSNTASQKPSRASWIRRNRRPSSRITGS